MKRRLAASHRYPSWGVLAAYVFLTPVMTCPLGMRLDAHRWHWQALREMEASYKLLLPICDAKSGTLASQMDVVAHDWIHAMDFGVAGEIASDDVRLPLEEVFPGEYELAVGVYQRGSGGRLSISGEALVTCSKAMILQGVVVR